MTPQEETTMFYENINAFSNQVLNQEITKSIRGSAADISNVVYFTGKGIFGVPKTPSAGVLWSWNDVISRWVLTDALILDHCDRVSDLYITVWDWVKENRPSHLAVLRSAIQTVYSRLKEDPTLIIRHTLSLFSISEPYFEDKLDANPDVIAFKDLIYNFKTREVRAVLCDDFITLSTGYNYPDSFDHDIGREIESFLSLTMENRQCMTQFQKWIANIVRGEIVHSTHLCGPDVVVNTIIDLICATLGSYADRKYSGNLYKGVRFSIVRDREWNQPMHVVSRARNPFLEQDADRVTFQFKSPSPHPLPSKQTIQKWAPVLMSALLSFWMNE